MPGTPPVPGEAASPDGVVAGLRIANARLRELLAELVVQDLTRRTVELHADHLVFTANLSYQFGIDTSGAFVCPELRSPVSRINTPV